MLHVVLLGDDAGPEALGFSRTITAYYTITVDYKSQYSVMRRSMSPKNKGVWKIRNPRRIQRVKALFVSVSG
jgi:hypothetical protein